MSCLPRSEDCPNFFSKACCGEVTKLADSPLRDRIAVFDENCQWRRQIVPDGGVKVYQSG
jgi:hypothetical protein